jgi:pilus assembly protein CpaE
MSERRDPPGLRIVSAGRHAAPGDDPGWLGHDPAARPVATNPAEPDDAPIRTVLVADCPASTALFKAALAEGAAFLLAGVAERAEHGLREVMKARPSLLLASLADPRAALELVERIAELYPDTAIFLATEADSPELLKRAMRAGVREVFARPPAPDELAQALRRLVRQRQQGPAHRRTAGEIIAVFSAKGGLGATFLATNLAVHLARSGEHKAAIVDLNLELGDVSTFLNVRAGHSILDLVSPQTAMDSQLVESTLATHRSGLKLLAQPEDAADADRVTGGEVGQILTRFKTMFEYTVVDTPRRFDERTLEALDLADHILLIAALDLPTIRNARRSVEVFQRLGYGERLKLIVNRHRADRTTERMERSFGVPVFWHLPDDYATAISAINAGVPAAEVGPESELSASIAELADALSGQHEIRFRRPRPQAATGLLRRLGRNLLGVSGAPLGGQR